LKKLLDNVHSVRVHCSEDGESMLIERVEENQMPV